MCDVDLPPVTVIFIQHSTHNKENNGTQGARSDGKGESIVFFAHTSLLILLNSPTMQYIADYIRVTDNNSGRDT